MSNRKDNHVNTPIEEGIHKYIEESLEYPKHGLLCLVFPELDQKAVEMLAEEIEEILEDKLNTLVMVDV